MIISICFYFFSFLLLSSCLGVVLFRNPVYSVFCLIFAFFNAAAVFVLLKAEFLAVILIMIYVGAVAVLFLFVILLVNIKVAVKRQTYSKYVLISVCMLGFFVTELYILFYNGNLVLSYNNNLKNVININSTLFLGEVLFSHYYYVFLLASLILMVAMIAAVVLIVPVSSGINKAQSVIDQNTRTKEDSVYKVSMKNEEGTK